MEEKKIRMIDIERLIDALAALFHMRSYQIITGTQTDKWEPRRLLAPDALLPVIVRLAEEQWKTSTSQTSFGLGIDHDDNALCKQTLNAVHYAPISIIVLCIDHLFQKLVDVNGCVTLEKLEDYARSVCPVLHSQPAPP